MRGRYMSWVDCKVLTMQMNEVNNRIVEALTSGKNENHLLYNHDSLSVALIDLRQTIERIQEKDKKEFEKRS